MKCRILAVDLLHMAFTWQKQFIAMLHAGTSGARVSDVSA